MKQSNRSLFEALNKAAIPGITTVAMGAFRAEISTRCGMRLHVELSCATGPQKWRFVPDQQDIKPGKGHFELRRRIDAALNPNFAALVERFTGKAA